VADVPVALRVEPVPFSGGHDHHDENRPKGKLSAATGTTNAEGMFVVEYEASEVGGEEEIIVSSSRAQANAKAKIFVRVGGLQALSAGPSENFVLVGKFGEPGVTSRHRDNHFGTETLIAKVRALADIVYRDSAYVLRINDISLPWGGVFDIQNNWSTPHSGHRVGVNVDIDEIDTNKKEIDLKYFQEKVENPPFNGRLRNEGNHFHITFR
jgi:hypothetical protein